MEGFKVFNPDWTSSCSDIVFEVGKTYRTAGTPKLCETGFHFCEDVLDCFIYYAFDFRNHVCRVKAVGEIDKGNYKYGDRKACTNELIIVEEVPWAEVFKIIEAVHPDFSINISRSADRVVSCLGSLNKGKNNIGNYNDGSCNVGSSNSGDSNAGNGNSGAGNSGDGNSGNGNAGSRNRGNKNAGSANAGARNAGSGNGGNFNAGSHNAGSRNVGDWNSGSGNRGCFCTERRGTIDMFDAPTNWSMSDWLRSRARKLLEELVRQYAADTGSATIEVSNESWRAYAQRWWSSLNGSDTASILLLPNFDPAKFLETTGIDVVEHAKDAGEAEEQEGETLRILESIAEGLEDLL